MKTINATKLMSQTLVGSSGDFPRDNGNCFSIEDDNKREYNIVNFYLENLEELIRLKKIDWPIKCLEISKRQAVINDGRIPDEWYRNKFCEVCTPLALLPLPQRLQHLRDIDRGNRVEHANGMVSIKVGVKSRKLKEKWTIEAVEEIEAGEDFIVGPDNDTLEEIADALNKEINVETISYKGVTSWKEGMPENWKPMFECENGYFYAPYIPLKKENKDE